MYEELVKRLRNCTSDIVEDCAGCPYQGGYKGTYCMNGLISEAADAIEGLSHAVDQMAEWRKKQWIPVTERLPEKPYGCLVVVWDNPIYGGGDMFLNYYPEFVGWDGEQWNDCDGEKIPLDVAYWMPLPETPKEIT